MAKYKGHRRIVEKAIGRALKAGEIVHHKDHDPGNNHPSNLIIVSKHEHNLIHFKGLNAFYKYRAKQAKK